MRHSYTQPTIINVCFDAVCSVCCRYFSLLLRRLCSGILSAILMARLQVAAPLCGAPYDLMVLVSCMQRATQQLSATSYISTCLLLSATDLLAYRHTCPQSSTVRSFTHSLTYRPSSPLLHVDLSLPTRCIPRCVCLLRATLPLQLLHAT